jgi:hypothetical protein
MDETTYQYNTVPNIGRLNLEMVFGSKYQNSFLSQPENHVTKKRRIV